MARKKLELSIEPDSPHQQILAQISNQMHRLYFTSREISEATLQNKPRTDYYLQRLRSARLVQTSTEHFRGGYAYCITPKGRKALSDAVESSSAVE